MLEKVECHKGRHYREHNWSRNSVRQRLLLHSCSRTTDIIIIWICQCESLVVHMTKCRAKPTVDDANTWMLVKWIRRNNAIPLNGDDDDEIQCQLVNWKPVRTHTLLILCEILSHHVFVHAFCVIERPYTPTPAVHILLVRRWVHGSRLNFAVPLI